MKTRREPRLKAQFSGRSSAPLNAAPLAGFFVGLPVANVVDALEGGDDFFVVRDHDDGGTDDGRADERQLNCAFSLGSRRVFNNGSQQQCLLS